RFCRGLLRHDVLSTLEFSQDGLRVILEFVCVGRLINELLQIVGGFLVFCLVTAGEECQAHSQIRIRIVGFLSNYLLKLNNRFVGGTRIEQHLRHVELGFGLLRRIRLDRHVLLVGGDPVIGFRRIYFGDKKAHCFSAGTEREVFVGGLLFLTLRITSRG